MASWVRLAGLLCLVTLANGVRVRCKLGEIEGSERTTPRTGKPYFAFTGIPYAKPPVGPLRLKNPEKLNSWDGVLNASTIAPPCIQKQEFMSMLPKEVYGEEDCLYLNVFTPSTEPSRKLPVLLHFHGGGFRCGAAIGRGDSPSNFMEEDVIFVSSQYRLGVLGFLSTEDTEIPGNYGLKDQAMAVKWVFENIEAFGGNPSSITVMGESAGGTSAHYLITSPLTKDLLKGGIAQSGTVDAKWAVAPPGVIRKNTKKLAETVGCDINQNLLPCLQKKDAAELQSSESVFLVWDLDPVVNFRPVIEPAVPGAFLTQDPTKESLTTPFITGIMTGEGLMKSAGLLSKNESVIDLFFEDFDNIMPQVIFVELSNPNLPEFISAIKEKYFKNLFRHHDKILAVETLLSDCFFNYPMYKALQRHNGTKYGYIFDHRAFHSIADFYGATTFKSDKPSHGDDIMFLFNLTDIFPTPTEEDRQVSIRWVNLWSNFAKYQNPTPADSAFTWRQFDAKNGNVLHITTNKNNNIPWPYVDVVEFWDNAYKILERSPKLKEEL